MNKELFAAIAIAFLFIISCCGCEYAQADVKTETGVTKVLEHNGTIVYRFYDLGEYRYFSTPSTATFTITKDSNVETIIIPVEQK